MPIELVFRRGAQAVASSINSHRIFVYSLFSTLAVCAAIINALKNYSNFYSVAIYLSKSSRSVLILANFAFLQALICGHVIQKIFFGSLRPSEVERLYDRLWFFITESLLAFTIFRNEFDIPFALMFGFLLFVKSFHWLAGDRIEWMDQRPYPGPPLLFHVRMASLFVILWFTDVLMFLVAIESTLNYGVGGMVLFASEYGILMASITNTILKYFLTTYELRRASRRGGENAPPWENKSMWVFYIELATDFMKLTTYLVFFVIIITFYGLPLNIVRDVYITARSFISRLRALHRYQSATRNMDQRYPNATEEEMAAMSDRTCIICREEMALNPVPGTPEAPTVEGPNTTPKKLPCGHIFHFYCLRSWLERQQSCPTCRRTVFENNTPANPGVVPVPGVPNAGFLQPQNDRVPGDNDRLPNGQGQGPNNPGANPAGLIGRMFGPPVPPLPVGQVPNGPLPPPNVVYGQQGAGQQPGLVIQYNIQYQLPRPPGQQGQSPSSQNLQPPPQFNGFYGPGGVWQPWPQEALNETQTEPNSAPGAQDNRSNGNSGESPLTRNGPSSSEDTSPADGSPSSSTADPREAAAAAALRRNERSNSARTTPTTITSLTTTASQSPTPANEGDSQPTPTAPSGHTSSQAAPQNHASPGQRLTMPSLIPMYDHNNALGYPQPNMYTPQPSPGIQIPHFRPQHSRGANQQAFPRGLSRPSAPHGDSGTPIASLPPTLTEEQLAVMDRVTREAIDERLRVLEGVSGAVNRCIDDLMRMRSILPSSGSVRQHQGPSETAEAGPGPRSTAASQTAPTSDVSTPPEALGVSAQNQENVVSTSVQAASQLATDSEPKEDLSGTFEQRSPED